MAKSSFSLEELFLAIHDSVTKATAVARDQGKHDLTGEFFEFNEDESCWVPKTIRVKMPVFVAGKQEERIFDVPLYALAKHQSLVMKELKIDLDVELDGLDEAEAHNDDLDASQRIRIGGPKRGLFSSITGGRRKGARASVEIKFEGGDPAEGVLRLNDKLVQVLPS